MARQTRSNSSKKTPAKTKEAPDEAIIPKVIIIELIPDEQGNLRMDFNINGLSPYELPTLLKRAAHIAEKQVLPDD